MPLRRTADNVLLLAGKAGHDGPVAALVISEDGKWVATGSDDTTVILWDAHGACISQEWFAHDGIVRDLAFSPDNRSLATAGDDRKVKVWDITRDACTIAVLEGSLSPGHGCTWSRDGATIAALYEDGLIQLWDACTYQQTRILDEDRKSVV